MRHVDTWIRLDFAKENSYVGNYSELEKHAILMHPHSRPSEVDPARQPGWENFRQSSNIIDVLSIIQAEMPRGVVLGDYVIEYGDDGSGDDYENFSRDDGNWWTSCFLYFDSLRASRDHRRARMVDTRRTHRRSNYETSNSDDSSVASVDMMEYRIYDTEDDISRRSVSVRGSTARRGRWMDSYNALCCMVAFLFHFFWT